MATVTFSEDFTPEKLAYELSRMQEAGITVTDQIGDGPDAITLSNEFGNSLVLSGEFSISAEGEIHGNLEKMTIAQSSVVIVTATDFGSIDVHEGLDGLSKALDPSAHQVPGLSDLLELLSSNTNERDSDTADYSAEAGVGGVTANLLKGIVIDTFGIQHHLKGFKNLSGSLQDDHLGGDNKNNVLIGNGGDDHLNGMNGADTLKGGAGNDRLSGSNGRDNLDGGLDDDVLRGGNGNDVLNGGTGSDILFGGLGRDTFVFAHPELGTDTIKDFRSHVDKIAIDFSPDAVEGLGSDDFFLSTDLADLRAGHPGLIYHRATGVLSYDADGAGGNDPADIAHFNPGTLVSMSDFDFVA